MASFISLTPISVTPHFFCSLLNKLIMSRKKWHISSTHVCMTHFSVHRDDPFFYLLNTLAAIESFSASVCPMKVNTFGQCHCRRATVAYRAHRHSLCLVFSAGGDSGGGGAMKSPMSPVPYGKLRQSLENVAKSQWQGFKQI